MKRFNAQKGIINRTAALTWAVCLLLTCFPCHVRAEETNIPADAVIISTAEDFKKFAADCTLDSNSLGKYYVLTADISIDAELSVPSFSGIFDGMGHTVSGLKLSDEGSARGLFRYVEKDGVVKDLNVSGSVVPGGSGTKCGGIAGVNRGRIISCRFNGVVKGTASCGGITGRNEESGLIVNCVSGGAVQARNLAGGTAGENGGTIIHCENNSSVNTNAYDEPLDLENLNADEIYSPEQAADITDAGGIAGYSSGAVQGCTNNGNIGYPHVGYNIGGIAGRQDGYISGCENYGTVNGRKDTAGIVGQAEPHFSLLFSERTLTRLRTQLEELNGIIDETVTHTEQQSDVLSADTDSILDGLNEMRRGADSFLDETDRIVNVNIDSVNELSSRLSDLVDMTAPAADSFTEASDLLTASLEDLAKSVRLLDEAGDHADEGLGVLFPILDELSEITEDLTSAGNSVDSGLEALQRGLGDEETMRAALEKLSADFKNLSLAMSNLSISASNAVNALNSFTASPEYTAAKDNISYQLDRLSGIAASFSENLKNSESDIRAISSLIEAGIYDVSEYSVYIENILNNFSDGSISDIFDCISAIASSSSDIVTSQAAKELHNTLSSVAAGLPGEFEYLGTAGQSVSEDAGIISDNTNITSLYDFIRYIRAANGSLSRSTDPINDMINAVRESSEYFDEAGASMVAAAAAASDAADKASSSSDKISDGFDQITATLDYFAGMDKVTFTGADESLIASREELSGLAEKLIGLCGGFADSTDSTVNVIAEDIRRINNKASEVRDTLLDLAEEMSAESKSLSDYMEDISSQDTAGRSNGKIAGCTNYGQINGDINVGGITGSMAIDYDFDPEGDIETVGERSIDFMYQSKTVVRECVNHGEIIAKRSGAGGIAGSMDTGCLIGCSGFGDVSSQDGSYVGGITGQSEAAVFGCFAKCRVSGDDYVGGIAGEGNDISSCRSFVEIAEGIEYIGAIAGSCTGELSGNTFIDGGVGGVDGISYSGKAYPVRYEYMIKSGDVPEEFGRLTLTFIAEGEKVAELECGYGESISEDELPAIPAKEGYFAEWEDFDFSRVSFGAEINAVYSELITSLSSIELRENGLPIFIAEGSFTSGGKLTALSGAGSGYVSSDTWTVTLPDDGSEVHTIRYLPAADPKKAIVTVTENGTVRTADTELDGSYLVFTVSGNSFDISVTEKTAPPWLYPAIGGTAAAAAVIAAVIIIVKKKKRQGASAGNVTHKVKRK